VSQESQRESKWIRGQVRRVRDNVLGALIWKQKKGENQDVLLGRNKKHRGPNVEISQRSDWKKAWNGERTSTTEYHSRSLAAETK